MKTLSAADETRLLQQIKQPRELEDLKHLRSEEQFEYLADEYVRLDRVYDLLHLHRVTFGMFMAKPWYYREFIRLLDDGGTVWQPQALRSLLEQQKAVAARVDHDHLRPESKPRLHNGQIFQPLRHRRYPRGAGAIAAFFRRRS